VTLTAGMHSITATYAGNYAYISSTSAAVSVGVVNASILAYGGSGQSAAYGSAFAAPLMVALKGPTGTPLVGFTVVFAGTGVKLSSATAVSDANGIAAVTATATTVGAEKVVATLNGAPAPVFVLTGTKAPLTVAATSFAVALGQGIPTLRYSISGLVNGDGASAFTGTPVLTTAAVKGSAAGAYPITVALGTLASTNYSFVPTPGTVTVGAPGTAAALAIVSGNTQTGPVGTLLPVALTVVARDGAGNPMAGAAVTFTGTGMRVTPATAITNANGIAWATGVPTSAGPVTAVAASGAASVVFGETGK